jgi:hypothetical protein
MAWTLAGAGLGAGLFWGFLNTPESNALMLGLSLLLALAIAWAVGTTTVVVLEGWAKGWPSAGLRGSVRGLPGFVAAGLVAAGAWWVVGLGQEWLVARSGEISAWFIATFDWSDVRPLLDGLRLAGDWLRTVAVPFAVLTWLARVITTGWRRSIDGALLRHALSPWRLAMVTAVAGLTIWAPLTYGLYWRPLYTTVPPAWVEPTVSLAKFALIAVVAAAGLGVIARLAASSAPALTAPPSSSSPR